MKKHYVRQAMAVAVATAIQSGSAWVMAEDEALLSLEEIVVTAQKREQSLQDVPLSVNSIDANALTDMKLFNFSDLEQVSSGLDMRNIDGRAGSIALRGVDFNPNSGASPAVDVYWNGVTLGANASGGIFQEMFDLQRVEVLRGPQGALQGRTSPAGALAIHTAKPDMEEVEGYVRTTFMDNSSSNTQFGVSLPIIPGQLSVRVAGVYNDSEMSGLKNIHTGDVSDTQTEAGRVTVVWQPLDTLSVELAYQYLENDLSSFSNLSGQSTLAQGLPDLEASDRKAIALQPDSFIGHFENSFVKVDWELADHQLTFVSGYSEISSERSFDNGEGNTLSGYTTFAAPHPLSVFSQAGVTGSQLNDPQVMIDQNYASSQELRLSSMENEFWDYTLGIYHGNESGYFNRQLTREQKLGGGNSLFFDTEARSPFSRENYGVFSHNIFHLTDKLTAQAALRWQRQESTTNSALFTLEDVFAPPSLVVPTAPEGTQLAQLIADDLASASSEAWTGSVSLQYAFDEPDTVAYVNIGTSYRPGGVTVAASNLGDLTEYNEEDSWSLEVGVKSKWLDNRLRLNAAVFHQEYSDYIGRVSRVKINTGASASITTNGDAAVQGIELDGEYLLTENWHLAGSLSYTEAEYKDGAQIPCNGPVIAPGEVAALCDVGGLELGTQPRFSANISSNYSLPFDLFEGYVSGLYKFTGRRTDVDAASGDLGGYGTMDLHLGARDYDGQWDISVFARNLFDKDATESIQPELRTLSRLDNGYLKARQIMPRLIGVSATYNF